MLWVPLLASQAACSGESCESSDCRQGVLLVLQDPPVMESSMLIELRLDDSFVECAVSNAERNSCLDAGVEIEGDQTVDSIYLRDRVPTRIDVSIFAGESHSVKATVW